MKDSSQKDSSLIFVILKNVFNAYLIMLLAIYCYFSNKKGLILFFCISNYEIIYKA